MNNIEFVNKLTDIAKNYKTLYVMGCIGANMTEKNKERYTKNHSYNKKEARKKMILNADENTWGFDCVCLIKSVLWGWQGDKNKNYGGAEYLSNDVPDINADQMISKCSNLSTDFSEIELGEALWLKGHIGIYIGDGLAVECTPSWKNSVQITAVNKSVDGYPTRKWTKHGKLPYIIYEKEGTGIMRYFQLLDEMNIRSTPNGTKIGVAPKGAVISGTNLKTNKNTTWIETTYNGISGYICVLPESAGYAKEVFPSTDYKALYEAEKIRAEELQNKINAIKDVLL